MIERHHSNRLYAFSGSGLHIEAMRQSKLYKEQFNSASYNKYYPFNSTIFKTRIGERLSKNVIALHENTAHLE